MATIAVNNVFNVNSHVQSATLKPSRINRPIKELDFIVTNCDG